MPTIASIDKLFTQATESKAMPGIVAAAATDKGTVYEGAFGKRELGKDAAMTVDSVVWIASMTKAITGAAAMQLVERGKLSLDRPASEVVTALASAKVLEGFDAAGKPRLRAPKRPITLKHLMTHTAGFAYEIWRHEIAQYQSATNTPGITTCANAALTTPLLFDPGDRWEYGINIDWVGKMVEAVSGQKLDRYFQDNIFGPLGMKDTAFKISPSMRSRLAGVHQRDDKGTLAPIEFALPEDPEFLMGGGGLYGTARDYLAFTQMIVQGGSLGGSPGPQARDRRPDGAEPHRAARYPLHQDGGTRALQRRRPVPGDAEGLGAELPDQHAGRADRPLGRQPRLGWAGQHLFLDRSGQARLGRVPLAGAAVLRRHGDRSVRQVRDRGVPESGLAGCRKTRLGATPGADKSLRRALPLSVAC